VSFDIEVMADVASRGDETRGDWLRLLKHMTPWRVLVIGVAMAQQKSRNEVGQAWRCGYALQRLINDVSYDSIDGIHEEGLRMHNSPMTAWERSRRASPS